jgi:hypothetical protein
MESWPEEKGRQGLECSRKMKILGRRQLGLGGIDVHIPTDPLRRARGHIFLQFWTSTGQAEAVPGGNRYTVMLIDHRVP